MLQFSQINNSANIHDFDCGNEYLNDFLKKFALQNQERRLGNTYTLNDVTMNHEVLIGFYTLTFCHIDKKKLPKKFGGNLPLQVAAIKLARLAITKEFQGSGFGEILLADALSKAYHFSKNFGGYIFLVDSKPEAKSFYEKYHLRFIDKNLENYILGIRTKDIAQLFPEVISKKDTLIETR